MPPASGERGAAARECGANALTSKHLGRMKCNPHSPQEGNTMRLVFSGRAGSSMCSWNDFALFRDNVQHFVERGGVSGRFRSLHAIETAVDQGECTVNALRLRGEVLQGYYALAQVPLGGAAVSLRSRAILTGNPNAPARRGTALAGEIGWELPVTSPCRVHVPEAAHNFVLSVLVLTNNASQGELLQVRRDGEPPRFARASFQPKLPRIVRFGAMMLSVIGASACGPSTPRAGLAPEAEHPVAARNRRAPAPPAQRLVAPPPAYGNKIVTGMHLRAAREG